LGPKDFKIDNEALKNRLMDPKFSQVVQMSKKFVMNTDSQNELTALNSLLILSSGDKVIAGQFVIDLDYL
jgi:hypothetical protein